MHPSSAIVTQESMLHPSEYIVKPVGVSSEPLPIEYFISVYFLVLLELDLQVFPDIIY
jgi:hypothetical protein